MINCSLYGVIRQALDSGVVNKLIGARNGITGVLNERFLNLRGISSDVVDKLRRTPGSALGSCRYKVQGKDYETIIDVLSKHEIDIFLYNGGNDSMDTALQVHQLASSSGLELNVIGIPKTIDNDLPSTDRCPGFGSAARYVAQSVRDLGMDISTLPTPISIFEAMGRNAGWLAAASVLARRNPNDAPHLIYLPECSFDPEAFICDVKRVHEKLGWAVVVVSEGLCLASGDPVYSAGGAAQTDAFGHKLPGDVGSFLAGLVSEKLGLRCRSEKPGLCGRSSILLASPVDQKDAEAVGRAAVDAALAGESGKMVSLQPMKSSKEPETSLVSLESVANVERRIPLEWINRRGADVTQEFCDYVRPLIGSELLDYIRL